ncbi:MAG: PaaI family thioesterase [Acidimicrobiales bacterium]
MARHRLDNSRWGFESNCFVCEDSNASGLRIPFFHDDEAHTVEAQFNLSPAFSGAPNYVHGGLILAVLDEAMAWAAIAIEGAMALTQTTTTTFKRPVAVGRDYLVRARIQGHTDEGHLDISAEVTTVDDKACAQARAIFVALGPEQAQGALGVTVSGPDAGFIKGSTS